jgi:hypothetical protein
MRTNLTWAKALLVGVATATVIAATAMPAQASPATSMGPAYYLFHTVDKSVHANCAVNGLRGYIGKVNLRPYYDYREILTGSSQTGTLLHYYFRDEGFKTAAKYHSCVKHDFSFSYYGWDKVQRSYVQTWICYSGGCAYGGGVYGPWKNKSWA